MVDFLYIFIFRVVMLLYRRAERGIAMQSNFSSSAISRTYTAISMRMEGAFSGETCGSDGLAT